MVFRRILCQIGGTQFTSGEPSDVPTVDNWIHLHHWNSEPSLPLDIDGAPACLVHTLPDPQHYRNQFQYLVDWQGYGPEQQSWGNSANMLDPTLVEEFHFQFQFYLHPHRPALCSQGCPCLRTLGGCSRRVLTSSCSGEVLELVLMCMRSVTGIGGASACCVC